MGEQFQGEHIPSPENEEATEEVRLHKKLQEAINEIDRIIAEINKIFASMPDQNQARKIILEQWMPLMNEAAQKLSELTEQWRAAINRERFQKLREKYTKK